MSTVSRGFRGRRRPTVELPPGQYLVEDFPVLSAGPTPSVELEDWELELLRQRSIRYVLMDRRKITDNQLQGYFFPTRVSPAPCSALPSCSASSATRCSARDPSASDSRS